MHKPLVFVGSSTEGLPLAQVIAKLLSVDFEPLSWNKGLFVPGTYTMEALEEAVHRCKFAVIIGTADDVLTKRGKRACTVRDNLVLELGLFIGAFSRKRALLAVPDGCRLALPTDLDGLTQLRYPHVRSIDLDHMTTQARDAALGLANQARAALGDEWSRMRAEADAARRKQAAGTRMVAIKRLLLAVVQLRDLLIEVPANAIAAIDKKSTFDGVKADAVRKVQTLYAGWEEDAKLVGTARELESLAVATRRAVQEFPYPLDAVPSLDDTAGAVVDLLAKSFAAFKADESPLRQAQADATSIVRSGLNAFADAYKRWWLQHSAEMARCARDLHDALSFAALGVAEDAAAA